MMQWMRCGGWLCGMLLVMNLTGCQQTPHQQLMGRWYNDEMSIRFRNDGRVLLFSRSGRLEGRYVFAGTTANHALGKQENLVLDVIRDGKPRRMVFDAGFLGGDRLRLTDLTPQSRRTIDPAPEFAILRRGTEPPVSANVPR